MEECNLEGEEYIKIELAGMRVLVPDCCAVLNPEREFAATDAYAIWFYEADDPDGWRRIPDDLCMVYLSHRFDLTRPDGPDAVFSDVIDFFDYAKEMIRMFELAHACMEQTVGMIPEFRTVVRNLSRLSVEGETPRIAFPPISEDKLVRLFR